MCMPDVNRPCLWGLRSTVKSKKVGADATVVKQRVPFTGRPTAADGLPCIFRFNPEGKQLPLGLARLMSSMWTIGRQSLPSDLSEIRPVVTAHATRLFRTTSRQRRGDTP